MYPYSLLPGLDFQHHVHYQWCKPTLLISDPRWKSSDFWILHKDSYQSLQRQFLTKLKLPFMTVFCVLIMTNIAICQVISALINITISFFFFQPTDVVDYIDCLLYVKSTLYIWKKCHLVMVHNSLNAFLSSSH